MKCTVPGCVVNKGVLHQRAEDEEDTHPRPDVHRLGVGHGRQGALNGGHRGGHRQECCHAQIYPSWGLREREKMIIGVKLGLLTDRFVIDPEGEPGDDDDHESGEVDGDDVVAHLPGEQEVHLEAAVLP